MRVNGKRPTLPYCLYQALFAGFQPLSGRRSLMFLFSVVGKRSRVSLSQRAGLSPLAFAVASNDREFKH
jgi:hypothetical protein